MKLILNGGGVGEQVESARKLLNDLIDHTKKILYIPLAWLDPTFNGCLEFMTGELSDVDKAGIDLYKNSLPDWYQTSGQKIEQLCKQLKALTAFLPKDKIDQLISGFASDFELKLRVLAGANEETLTKIREYII